MNEQVTQEALDQAKAEILNAIAAESHSTVELGINSKGEVVWTVKARAGDVNEAAFDSQRIHEAFATRYGRGEAINDVPTVGDWTVSMPDRSGLASVSTSDGDEF